METAIIVIVAIFALLVFIGAGIMCAYIGGLAGGAAMGFLLKHGMPKEQMPDAEAAHMTADESNAIVAESQRLLRESQQREAFNKANPL